MQVALWLGAISAIIAAYFLLFPIALFWLFRLEFSSSPLGLESTLQTLCTPLEWLQERLPWYEGYLNWLMELMIA